MPGEALGIDYLIHATILKETHYYYPMYREETEAQRNLLLLSEEEHGP